MRKHGKTDANHAAIRDGLRAIGCQVVDLSSVGGGVPDLLVGWRKRLVLIEVKDPSQPPSKRALTKEQKAFHASFKTLELPCFVVETLERAIGVMGGVIQ